MGGNEASPCRYGICPWQQGQDIRLPRDIQGRRQEADNALQTASGKYHQRVRYETGL